MSGVFLRHNLSGDERRNAVRVAFSSETSQSQQWREPKVWEWKQEEDTSAALNSVVRMPAVYHKSQ